MIGAGWQGNDDVANSNLTNITEDINESVENVSQFLAGGELKASAATPLTPIFDLGNAALQEQLAIAASFSESGGGGGSTPKGPLGHPFYGPFRGPIY